MLTAIEGTYDHGQIILDEIPAVQKRTKVIVTFLEDDAKATKKPHKAGSSGEKGIQFGSLAGKVAIPANFNEPLNDL